VAYKSLADIAAAKAPTAAPKKGGINLGLGSLLSSIKAAPGGLWNVLSSIAPGGQKSLLPEFARGTTQGLANLATDVGSLGIPGLADLEAKGMNAVTSHVPGGDWAHATPLSERLHGQGLLPTLASDIGSAAIIAGPAAKLLGGAGEAGAVASRLGLESSLSPAGRLGDALGISRSAKLADAGRLASTGNVSGASEAAAAAERVGKVADALHNVAHPYKFAAKKVLGPLANEFADRSMAAAAGVPEEAAGLAEPAIPAPAPAVSSPTVRAAQTAAGAVGDMGEGFGERAAVADQAVSKLAAELRQADPKLGVGDAVAEAQRRIAEPRPSEQLADAGVRATPAPGARAAEAVEAEGPAARNTDMGSSEIDARARAAAPAGPVVSRVADALGHVPGAAKGFEFLSRRIQAHDLRQVTREQEILADASRRSALASPEVQQMATAARDQILAKHPTMPDGSPVTPQLADEMFGDAVRSRASGVEPLIDAARASGVKDDVLAQRGLVGQNRLPSEWLQDPELQDTLDQAVANLHNVTAEQQRILSGGRPGDKGLGQIGSEEPLKTRADKRAEREITRQINRAENARRRLPIEAEQAQRRVARQEDATVRSAEAIKRTEAQLADSTRDFHNTRAPAVMRIPERWAAARRAIVDSVREKGGATFNVTDGRLVVPFAYADEAAQAAARAAGGAGTGEAALGHAVSVLDLLDEPMPVEEFMAVDPTTGATRGEQVLDQLARQFQDVFSGPGGPDLNIGTWVDNGKVYVDLSQYTINGAPITRDQAMLMGAARDQVSVMDFQSGDFLDTSATSGLRSDIAAALMNTGHRYHDRQANAYRGLVEREATAAEAEGRAPRFGNDYIDAVMEADRRAAAFLHETQPQRFPKLDDVFRAIKTTTGTDPNRVPGHALLQWLPALKPGDAGAHWWNLAQQRFPNWEELAAWYDRSHDGIEREFRGKSVRTLDGTERDLADVMYDLVALGSVQATPYDDLRYALRAGLNLKKTLADVQQSEAVARDLIAEFQQSGVQGPTFQRLAGNYLAPAIDQVRAEMGDQFIYGNVEAKAFAKRLVEEQNLSPRDAATEAARVKKLSEQALGERKQQLMMADPDPRAGIHMFGREQRRMLPILMGRPLDTWTPEFTSTVLPDLMGTEPKDLQLVRPEPKFDKAGRPVIDKTTGQQAMTKGNGVFTSVFRRAEARGVSVDEYITSLGEARAAALAGEGVGSAGREAALKFGPEDIARLGEEQAIREAVGDAAFAKLRSFRENLASPGASDAVTLDQWMMRLFGEGTGSGKYAKWADELRDGAAQLRDQGVTVNGRPIRGHHVQALLWAYAMDEATVATMIEKGLNPDGRPLPPAQDFEHILSDPANPHRQLLDQMAANNGFDGYMDMVMSSFTDKLKTHPAFQDVLYQRVAGDTRGATWADDAGNVTMRYFQTADARTLLHERAHGLRLLLGDADARALGQGYAGNSWDGTWTRAMEEAFAEDWSAISEGRTVRRHDVGPMLNRLHDYLTMMWQTVRDRIAGTRIPDAAHDLFDRVHNPERLDASTDPAINPYGREAGLSEAVSQGQAVAGKRMAEVARSVPGARAEQVSDAYAAGRQGQAALERTRTLEARLQKQQALHDLRQTALTKAKQALISEELPAEVRAAAAEGKAAKLGEAVAAHQEDPSLARTPPHLQPLWHAYTSLVDEAVKTGDDGLAQMLLEVGPQLSDVLRFAKDSGFDPQYIPKMQPSQVRRVVFESMKLGRGQGLGTEVEAGARKARTYARPELMDRSIAGLVSGMLDATHEAHTNALVSYLEEVVAKPVPAGGRIPDGWVPWSDSKQWIMTGEDAGGVTVGEAGAGQHLMIPKSVDGALRNYGKDYNHWVFNGIRKATQPWRTLVLPLRPAWYVNNVLGNVIMATASGVGLSDWAEAWRGYRGGKLPTQGRLESTFGVPGVAGGLAQDMATDVGSLVPDSVRGQVRANGLVRGGAKAAATTVHRLGRANEVVDNMARVAAYISGKKRGLSEADALIFAQKALVDYGDMSPFERAYVRTAVPFYAWQKGILKLAARQAWDHPAAVGIMLRLGDLNRELQKDKYGAELPGGYANMVSTPFGNMNLSPINPFGDAAALLTPQGIASSLNPYVEAGAREALGAPQFGIADHYRESDIGSAEPMPNTAGDLKDLFAFAPPFQAARSQSGAIRFSGAPVYSDAEVQKIVDRTRKTQAKIAGQTPIQAGLAQPKAPKTKGKLVPPRSRASLSALGRSS
jgi:hypothetical protein